MKMFYFHKILYEIYYSLDKFMKIHSTFRLFNNTNSDKFIHYFHFYSKQQFQIKISPIKVNKYTEKSTAKQQNKQV